jgi:hypothetical protein
VVHLDADELRSTLEFSGKEIDLLAPFDHISLGLASIDFLK